MSRKQCRRTLTCRSAVQAHLKSLWLSKLTWQLTYLRYNVVTKTNPKRYFVVNTGRFQKKTSLYFWPTDLYKYGEIHRQISQEPPNCSNPLFSTPPTWAEQTSHFFSLRSFLRIRCKLVLRLIGTEI